MLAAKATSKATHTARHSAHPCMSKIPEISITDANEGGRNEACRRLAGHDAAARVCIEPVVTASLADG